MDGSSARATWLGLEKDAEAFLCSLQPMVHEQDIKLDKTLLKLRMYPKYDITHFLSFKLTDSRLEIRPRINATVLGLDTVSPFIKVHPSRLKEILCAYLSVDETLKKKHGRDIRADGIELFNYYAGGSDFYNTTGTTYWPPRWRNSFYMSYKTALEMWQHFEAPLTSWLSPVWAGCIVYDARKREMRRQKGWNWLVLAGALLWLSQGWACSTPPKGEPLTEQPSGDAATFEREEHPPEKRRETKVAAEREQEKAEPSIPETFEPAGVPEESAQETRIEIVPEQRPEPPMESHPDRRADCAADPRLGLFCRTVPCAQRGKWRCSAKTGKVECVGKIVKEAERCDGYDNDCDGLADEGDVCPKSDESWVKRFACKSQSTEDSCHVTDLKTRSQDSVFMGTGVIPSGPWAQLAHCGSSIESIFMMKLNEKSHTLWGVPICYRDTANRDYYFGMHFVSSLPLKDGEIYTFSGNQTGPETESRDCILSLWGANGKQKWSKVYKGAAPDYRNPARPVTFPCRGMAMVLGVKNRLHLVGTARKEVDFGTSKLKFPWSSSAFAATADKNGNVLSSRVLTSTAVSTPYDNTRDFNVQKDQKGNLYLYGVELDVKPGLSRRSLQKYDANWKLLWTRFPKEGRQKPSLSVTATGESYLVSGDEKEIVKYDTQGKLLWTVKSTGPTFHELALGPKGRLYVTGQAKNKAHKLGSLTMGPLGKGEDFAFVAQLDAKGTFLKVVTAHVTSPTKPKQDDLIEPQRIAVDPKGNVYVAGRTEEEKTVVNFGGKNSATAGRLFLWRIPAKRW